MKEIEYLTKLRADLDERIAALAPEAGLDGWKSHGNVFTQDVLPAGITNDTPVEAKLRDGAILSVAARALNWSIDPDVPWPSDIVAYRVKPVDSVRLGADSAVGLTCEELTVIMKPFADWTHTPAGEQWVRDSIESIERNVLELIVPEWVAMKEAEVWAVSEPYAGEWHKWGGGPNIPVGGNALVDAEFRDGGVAHGVTASKLLWKHGNHGGDIVAYRLAK